jgi:hypothetical protein
MTLLIMRIGTQPVFMSLLLGKTVSPMMYGITDREFTHESRHIANLRNYYGVDVINFIQIRIKGASSGENVFGIGHRMTIELRLEYFNNREAMLNRISDSA